MNNEEAFNTIPGENDPSQDSDQTNLPPEDSPEKDADNLTADYRTSGAPPAGASASKPPKTRPLSAIDKPANETPQKVGRYAIKKLLGRGGFGEVYLGLDEQLQREVAIKLTFGSRVGPAAVKMFLAEARILAELDHPNIVPVFDIGTTERGDIFIVSKLIDGTDLSKRIEQNRPSRELSLEIIAAIAEALHYAHAKGMIHRDIKPANILLDKTDRPYLADFGIALRETDNVGSRKIAGTPAYMSPEQARGEGHLMSNQSDIYSLGVVLYELLAGRRPFRAKSADELLRMVQTTEIRTPRTFDATISRELERVCLKALARRPSDRYAIAKDFADEVRYVIANHLGIDSARKSDSGHGSASPPGSASDRISGSEGIDPRLTPGELPSAGKLDSDPRSGPVRVVPKGLRSFDAKDSEFFLELLPGPFDRTGLPEALRFWKNRIEATDADESFRVGLVYGPSGCGKSSLMKAGLLPRLSPKIESIYIEATPEDTTGKLLRSIQKRIPEASGANLADALSIIRRRKLVPSGGKLLLVIDQFEQWLYAHKNYADTELMNALRQCDGVTIQAIVMVRDDFWLSVSRFLRELDIPIVERENSALVDLFDLDHAKKVLALFGRAYDKLPEDRTAWTQEQKDFLQQAVEGLSQEEKVISVRLALFAEMMKSKTWAPKTLADLGGIAGVGLTFLEETFGDKHAPIQVRQHQEGVRLLLGALLPAVGTNIKGHSRGLSELQETVGYQGRPREFAELVSLLDKNLRLITPVDESQQTGTENHSYQLTHDYLVPSLREWLTQKQRETKKGRAELKLAERAATWGANQENKQLPTLWEWMQIRRWTDKSKWSKPESQVMIKANRFHGTRIGLLTSAVALLIVSAIGVKSWIDQLETERAQDALVTLLKSAEMNRLPDELKKVSKLRPGIDKKLDEAIEATSDDSEERLKLNLALLGSSPKALDYVESKLSDAEAKQVPVLVSALQPYADQLKDKYWSIAEEKNAKSLLPVASALALWDPTSDRWTGVSSSVVDQLVKENPLRLATWIETLRPAKAQLVTRLQQIVLNRGGSASPTEKDLALDMLESYVENFETLHELIVLGEPKVFAKIFPRYQKFQKQALEKLQQELAVKVPGFEPANEADPSRLVAIERQANAAVALLRLEDPKPVYEFLTVDRDPEALSQFIYRIRGREVSSSLLIRSFNELRALPAPDDATKRQQHYDRLYGMILGLGEYPLEQLPSAERDGLLKTLATMYAEHPSRTIHSAVGWLLRRWGQDESARSVEEKELDYDATGAREWYVIQVEPPKGPNKQEEGSIDLTAPIYFTMLVYPGGEFEMGDPVQQETKNVPGPFAVSDREVTWRQFSAVDDDTHRKSWEKQFKQEIGGRRLHPNEPVFGVNWFDAVNYCRWLTESRMPGEKNQCYVKKNLSGSLVNYKGWLSFPSNTDGAWEWPMNPKRGGFRLLTEAEWEYVARGGMETQYSFGSSESLLAEYGWFIENSAKWSHRTQQLRPSIAGVFDIHGNLGEWVDDWYTEGSGRVYRGGSWGNVAANCRSASRNRNTPVDRNRNLGFRVALSPSGIPQSPEADK